MTSNTIKKFKRKISRKGTLRAGRRFTLLISNEDMNDIIRIIPSLKETRIQISFCIVSTISSFINATSDFFCRLRYKWKRS